MSEQDPLANNSALPDTVQAVKNLEQRRLPTSTATPPTLPKSPKPSIFTRLSGFLPGGRLGTAFKVMIALAGVTTGLLLVYAVLLLTTLDTAFIKMSLTGMVVDQDRMPIAGATVILDNGTPIQADEDGRFYYGSLNLGQHDIKVSANGYEGLEQTIAISRSFLNYNNYRVFTLQSSGRASLEGKLVGQPTDYTFLDDEIRINEESFPVNSDGTFAIDNLKTGDYIFSFRSANFRDIKFELKLVAGDNAITDQTLVPAGDATGKLISWVREDLLLDTNITVESVPDAQVEVAEDGSFAVMDLEAGKEYKIRTEANGYQTRDYTLTIEPGINEIFGFKMVEEGQVPYLRQVASEMQIFVSDLDGENEAQLTSGRPQPYAEHIADSTVYFLSSRDGVNNTLGGEGFTAYAVSTLGGQMQRLTNNTTNWGRIIPNFTAQKLANVRRGASADVRILEIMKLDGSGRVEIENISTEDITFDDVLISDNGEYVIYHMQDSADTVNGLYRSHTNNSSAQKLVTREDIQIYSVSQSGNRIIYTATNESTGLVDLMLYTVSSRQDTTLKQSYSGSQFQFVKGSENLVLFFDLRDSGSNVYLLDIAKNTETRLTNFKATEGVEAVYQQSGYILYQTNKGLYVMDVNKPIAGKLITNSLARYTGYDF